jgi:hypothetical protein
LRVDLTTDSGAVSGDVASIKLFEDVNNDGIFNVEETTTDADGALIHLTSQGTETFSDRVTTLLLQPQVIVSESVLPAGKNYFLTYDINPFAQVGVNVGALIASTNYFTVAYPDFPGLVSTVAPFTTSRASILEASDEITLAVHDSAKVLSESGGTYQASSNVEVLRFTLTTNLSQAYWSAMRLERIGTSAEPTAPYGHNADVKYVKIYRDVNFNDQLDSGDELLTSATAQFSQVDENDRIINLPLTSPVLVSPTARSFFVAYDIGDGAEAGASVGLKIADLSWISVSAPNTISPAIKLLDASGATQSYPFETKTIPINAIRVSLSGATLSPAQIPQLSTGVPVLMFSMYTNRNYVTLKKLKLKQTGTIETSQNGQGDISRVSIWRDNGNTIFEPSIDTLIGSVLHGASTDFVSGTAFLTLNNSSGQVVGMDQLNFFVTVDVGETSVNATSTKGHKFGLKIERFSDLEFIPATAGADPNINFATLIANETVILDEGSSIVAPAGLMPDVWANPFGDGYPSVDDNGTPMPRTYDPAGVPMVDIDNDGINDIIIDAATGLPGVDMDGDGLIEIDMMRSGKLAVDFNNDGRPDCVLPDQNGDSVPEIDLTCDENPDFGYIPEKWSKETSRLYARWARVESPALQSYEIGVGMNNMSNGVTFAQGNDGWTSTEKDNFTEIDNLTLLSAKVTTLARSVDFDDAPPFTLRVADATDFDLENGQIQVGSEIMGYSSVVNNEFFITRRGEYYGVARHPHRIGDVVTNTGYVVRARAITAVGGGALPGAESAIKMYRVDVSPPSIPGVPMSDQELAGGTPSKTGVYTVRWSPAADKESSVRAYEIQERKDNDPVWTTIRVVPASQRTLLIGNKDNPSNMPKEPGHFFTYRVRAINQAGSPSVWSAESGAAATGLPDEAITKVTNYPNPVDTRQGPTNVSYILNAPSTVKITLFDLLGYQLRIWEFSAGSNGGKLGPNVFQWDGTDDSGRKVAAGGYIMRIEVTGEKGSTTVLRKIGIIN